MSRKRYAGSFKEEAVKQVIMQGYGVAEVASGLGVSSHSIYAWIKQFGHVASEYKERSEADARIRQLEKDPKRVTQERDILKKATAYFASQSD